MTAVPLTLPLWQSFGSDGTTPNSGGLIYFYAAGTSTPKDTYTDQSAATPNANPVVLDSAGRAAIWVNGSYKVVVKTSAGVTISTTDNYTSFSDSTGSTVTDSTFIVQDDSDTTKKMKFQLSSLTTGTTTVITVPDGNSTMATSVTLAAAVAAAVSHVNEFRLTLTTATPVTTSDVTGATTIYCTPYKGNRIALYNGVTWDIISSSEVSVALGTITNDLVYDVFCYNNAGTPTLEILAWTNNTTRATALVMQDGVLSKTGELTRRYLGTFCTTSTTTTEDSKQKRLLFNYYNRVAKTLKTAEETGGGTGTWNYSSTTIRQANANTANQVEVVTGIAEDVVSVRTPQIFTFNSTATYRSTSVGVGLNSTTSYATTSSCNEARCTSTIAGYTFGSYSEVPPIGKNVFAWLEKGASTDTQSWYAYITSGYSKVSMTGSAFV